MSPYRKCPVCGVTVKLENVSSHMDTVHPRAKTYMHTRGVGARPRRRSPAPKRGSSSRKLLYALVAVGLLIASMAVYGLVLMKPPAPQGGVEPPAQVGAIEVYLQPTCGCCHQYMDYLERNGFDVTPHEMTDLSGIKDNYGIPVDMQSCHTSVLGTYFVEGHVPVAAIQKLVKERPAIDGISLPGMPPGSPGMGGAKVGSFIIHAIEGGQATVFMEI